MAKVIIGIHGLSNKPPKDTLAAWWETSLIDGLRHVGVAHPSFRFKMVYWADRLYKESLHDDELYHFDVLYNDEPYVEPAEGELRIHKDSILDGIRSSLLDAGGTLLDKVRGSGNDAFSAWVLEKTARDLAFYFNPKRKIAGANRRGEPVRKVLDGVLRDAILEEQGHDIMLITHSMGTIIAYNVLRDLGRTAQPPEIAEFITMGSPLGIPYIKTKIASERTYDSRVRTPSVVKSWVNYADPRDKVALDLKLRDDYKANDDGVRVRDDIVDNTYNILKMGEDEPTHNHHKSYGYLRTPELAEHVKSFLNP